MLKAVATIGPSVKSQIEAVDWLPFGADGLDSSVREDVKWIQEHPLLQSRSVTGWVFDVDTGKLRQVE